jgi:hypothetical protein
MSVVARADDQRDDDGAAGSWCRSSGLMPTRQQTAGQGEDEPMPRQSDQADGERLAEHRRANCRQLRRAEQGQLRSAATGTNVL